MLTLAASTAWFISSLEPRSSEVVKVGQEVEVQVLDVDLNRERISLVLSRLPRIHGVYLFRTQLTLSSRAPSPLATFGAFVDSGRGAEPVHISEMVTARHRPSQVCKLATLYR